MIFFTKESLVANLSQCYTIYDKRLVQGESKCSFVKCAQIKRTVFLFFYFFCIFAVSCFVCDIKASEHTANEKELFADVQIFNYQ